MIEEMSACRITRGQVQSAPKNNWHRFWVIVSGALLQLYPSTDMFDAPAKAIGTRHQSAIVYKHSKQSSTVAELEGCLAHAVVDSVSRREHVFALLEAATGNVFLFQACKPFHHNESLIVI